ncbi:hypothetical protein [Halorubrum ezzemoulense]|uniref:Uncharacterized protein n=1 Tax=Halorubrum ezzemoulense TaxID=337243 RepID=A0A256JTY3_HALEZ|nr:hypothetical protein [Halorubrum ezzemoulense]OYR72359.1 hypothetical protein DJ78_03120 [Halorubrum ezzemoulense]
MWQGVSSVHVTIGRLPTHDAETAGVTNDDAGAEAATDGGEVDHDDGASWDELEDAETEVDR